MRHVPVLLEETLDGLDLSPGKRIIDCTLGDAGHASEIMKRISPEGMLLGIDADPEAIIRAQGFLQEYGQQVVYVRDNFEHLADIVARESFRPVDGIVMDLGWSTPQFADRHRGFSFQNMDEPLDMRYDAGLSDDRPTAMTLLTTLDEAELERIFREYGEERLASLVAERIVAERGTRTFAHVKDLVEVVLIVYREKLRTDKEVPWVGGLHPATKVFQALRIAVNDELGVVERALPQALDVLSSGGRLAVITFHSLEDRIVKHFFKKYHKQKLIIHTKKPIVAGEQEYRDNPRARSAKLRIIEKI